MSTTAATRFLTGPGRLPSVPRFPGAEPPRPGRRPAAIDTRVRAFLNSSHFVVWPDSTTLNPGPVRILFALAVLSGGCASPPPARTVEDSLTSGRISIVCAAEAESLLRREVEAFQSLYPDARVEIRAANSRDAVGALFGASADLALITRELETEERAAAVRGGLALEGFRIAADALVVVAHPANPVENVALDDLRAVYEGAIADWSGLGGARAPIVPVVQPPESDVTAFFVQGVMGGEPIRAAAAYAADDAAVVARVRATPGAIGYVTLSTRREGLRELRLAPLKGMSYWKPDLEAVYRNQYPLNRYYHLYVREDGARLGHGLITFVTSRDGQRLVQESGLVPTAVPVRFVRRSPMLGSH